MPPPWLNKTKITNNRLIRNEPVLPAAFLKDLSYHMLQSLFCLDAIFKGKDLGIGDAPGGLHKLLEAFLVNLPFNL